MIETNHLFTNNRLHDHIFHKSNAYLAYSLIVFHIPNVLHIHAKVSLYKYA